MKQCKEATSPPLKGGLLAYTDSGKGLLPSQLTICPCKDTLEDPQHSLSCKANAQKRVPQEDAQRTAVRVQDHEERQGARVAEGEYLAKAAEDVDENGYLGFAGPYAGS